MSRKVGVGLNKGDCVPPGVFLLKACPYDFFLWFFLSHQNASTIWSEVMGNPPLLDPVSVASDPKLEARSKY